MLLWYSASPAVSWLSVLHCFLFYIDPAHVKNIVLQLTDTVKLCCVRLSRVTSQADSAVPV